MKKDVATIITKLVDLLGEEAVLSGETLAAHRAGYPIPRPVRAAALVRPPTTGAVAELLRLCHEAGRPVIPYGGLTNLVQGTVGSGEEIALSLERMDAIEAVDPANRTMTVQAGATLRGVQAAAAAAGLMYGVDFGVRDICTIGGTVATNAGGGQVFRYGMTRDQVLGLEVVLADGTILSSLNRMIKNNSGYDLKQLFIGSEGTLGIVTRVVLRLREPPAAFTTALVAVDRFDQVVTLLKRGERELGGRLVAFEVMWGAYYETVLSALAPAVPPLPGGHAYYILLEAALAGPDGEDDPAARLVEQATLGMVAPSTIAQSEAERAALWAIRYGSEQIDYRYAPIFNFDISLPVGSMEAYIQAVQQRLAATFDGVRCWCFGHLADGNLHLMVRVEEGGEAERHRAEEIVYGTLQRFDGSISAEHGIGLEKREYLHLSRTPEEITFMRQLKATLDPKGILNPGKVLPHA